MNLLYLSLFILLGNNASFNNVEGLRAQKIVGGSEARRREFKYVVAIMYKSAGTRDQNPCTGGILSDWFIATVAHCFYDKIFGEWRRKLFYIISSIKDFQVPVLWSQNILVDSVTVPIVYDPDKPDNHATEGNFAMVKLAASLEIDGNKYSLARLIPRKTPFKNLHGKFFVAAFGYQEVNVTKLFINGELHDVQKGSSDGKLHYAKAELLSHTDCQDILQDNIAPGLMCAQLIGLNKDSPAGICKFDSGAPLTHHFYIDGLAINGGPNCNDNESPGIYINIMEYNTFIRNVMQNETNSNMLILQLRKDNEGEYMFRVMSTAQQD